jgi:hypothetical protein
LLRGRRIGWTARDSQSGYHAVRALIASAFGEEARLFFGATAGPFLTPMGIIEAIADGRIAAGPLDAYAFDDIFALAEKIEAGLLMPSRSSSRT